MTQRERLASLLLSRASPDGEIRMTQQQLADHIGTRREVVARQLLEFADQATIATGRGKIQLLDADKLRELTNNQVSGA
jgi:CRP/FNR family transcriptional regulator